MPKTASSASQADRSAAPAPAGSPGRVVELKVGGHLMTLDTGLFCVFHAPNSAPAEAASGLPGVRISLPPGPTGRPEAVRISTFRDDGWLSGDHDAALVRVSQGPAQILVTVYQLPQAAEAAPRLQVLQLSAAAPARQPLAAAPAPVPAPLPLPPLPTPAGAAEILAHIQRMGDVPGQLGDWVGAPGSQRWIEGFSIAPQHAIAPDDIEYQAVLGRGWLSPWVKGGEFCGSRGMALPILGLKLRLTGAAGDRFACRYAATFVDGSAAGPVDEGEACEAESLAPLEAFQVTVAPRPAAGSGAARRPAPKPAAGRAAAAPTATAKGNPAAPDRRPARRGGPPR